MMYTGKQLRALVMPLMFEQFLNVMVGMVDTLMVSKAGEAAVSGTGYGNIGGSDDSAFAVACRSYAD